MCGKFDDEPKPYWNTKRIVLVCVALVLIYLSAVLLSSGGDTNKPDRCQEMKRLMDDNIIHPALHDGYPLVMSDFDEFYLKQCTVVDIPSTDSVNGIIIKDGS